MRKEPIEDLTMAMAGGVPKEIRFRKAAKQAVCRKRKQLQQAVNYAVTDSDIEDAKDEFLEAFSKMEEAHDKVVAMNGFDSDSSVGTTYMEKPIQYMVTAIVAYKKWKAKRNAELGKMPSTILTDSANKKPARETHVPKEKDALFKG